MVLARSVKITNEECVYEDDLLAKAGTTNTDVIMPDNNERDFMLEIYMQTPTDSTELIIDMYHS